MSTEMEAQNGEAYGDNTILADVIGTEAKVRILSVLLADHNRDLNASDVARMAGIDRSTFYDHIDTLRAYGIVEQTRKVGNSKMYRINKESEAAKALGKFEWKLANVVAEKEEREEIDENGRPMLVE